ncbi:hypothetical protein [Candidatus Amarolinea aalborgensis]|jgi:hypothetical protein|uniref:hypothetical protein n=1 Tax=Candidatus Amarolinea aalborgensis TaxID=2249329 RepID=UPI003BF9AD6F
MSTNVKMAGPTPAEFARNDWALVITALIALLVGLVLRVVITTQTNTYAIPGGAAVVYPANWVADTTTGENLFSASNPRSGSTFATHMALLSAPLAANSTLSDAAIQWTLDLTNERQHFRSISSEAVRVAGTDGVRITYAYVADAGGSSLSQLPVVVQTTDTLVLVNGQVYALRYEADATVYKDDLGTYERALAALKF